MEGSTASTYWCYKCNQQIDPIIEIEIKCPNCNDTFVEEREGQQSHTVNNEDSPPLNDLIHMFTHGLRQRRRPNQEEMQTDEDANNTAHERASAIYHVIRNIEERLRSESDSNSGTDHHNGRRRVGHTIILSPSGGHAIIVGGLEGRDNGGQVGGTLGDYFVGPGLEDLIQQLAENDPRRYGTPPAEKLAVEAMPRVKVQEGDLGCSICLEEMEVGEDARMMPCKHFFHDGCILPWLELHSSCPVCRRQMPAQEVKLDRGVEQRTNAGGAAGAGGGGVGRRIMMTIMAPFGALFGHRAGDENDRD